VIKKSVLAGSEFHTGKILHDKKFLRILQEFCGFYTLMRDLWYLCCCELFGRNKGLGIGINIQLQYTSIFKKKYIPVTNKIKEKRIKRVWTDKPSNAKRYAAET